MKFDWDILKAEINQKKHGVDFADAVIVFEDDQAITIEDKDHSEERFVTLGLDAYGRLLVVIYCYVENYIIRIISARKANKIEQRFYTR